MSRRLALLLASLGLLLVGGGASAPAAMGGGGCHADATGARHTDGMTSVVRMDVCSFEPTVARVPVGTDVTFLNTAQLDHVVTGRGNTWGSETLSPGQQLVERFDQPGIFPYSCPLHPGMVAAIVVGDGEPIGAAAIDAVPAADTTNAGDAGSETAPAGGIDPALAIVLGGVAGLAILGLGSLLVRRRPGTARSEA